MGTCSGCWAEGLQDKGLHKKTFFWVEMPFFLPSDSLCKLEATEQKSGPILTTHYLTPDFWSAPHILINSLILGRYTKPLNLSFLKTDMIHVKFSTKALIQLVDCGWKFEREHFCQPCIQTTSSEISQKGHQRMKDMSLISYHLLSL